jgi:hypothetical protein
MLQLTGRGFAKDFLKPGDVVDVCGYAPKEPIVWQIAQSRARPAWRDACSMPNCS